MNYKNTDQLRGWLKDYPTLAAMESFELDDAEFNKHLAEVKTRPESERRDAAAFRSLPWNSFKEKKAEVATPEAIMIQQDQIIRNHAAQLEEQRQLSNAHVSAALDLKEQVLAVRESVVSAVKSAKESETAQREAVFRRLHSIDDGLKSADSAAKVFSEVSKLRHEAVATGIESIHGEIGKLSAVVVEAQDKNEHSVGEFCDVIEQWQDSQTKRIALAEEYAKDRYEAVSQSLATLHSRQHELASRKPMFPKWAVIAFAVLLVALLGADIAFGQNVNPAIVVAACGTPPSPYPSAGNRAPVTVDVNGNTCSDIPNPVPVDILGLFVNVSGNVTSSVNASVSVALVSGTASNYLYITGCSFNNTHASVDTLVYLQDGNNGNTIWVTTAPHGGGSNISFPMPGPLKVPTSGNSLYFKPATAGAAVTGACTGGRSTTSY